MGTVISNQPEGPAQDRGSRVSSCLNAADLFIAGAKEIDIAATLEHLRDQRPSMVQTKVPGPWRGGGGGLTQPNPAGPSLGGSR